MRLSDDIIRRVHSILETPQGGFLALVDSAGLDPAVDFRTADLSGADLSGCDLRPFDLSQADLRACDLGGTWLPAGLSLGQIDGSVLNDTRIGDGLVRPEDLPDRCSFKNADFAPELVVVPAGSFVMGSPEGEEGGSGDEGPRRVVTIGYRLAVGRYAVTFVEYDAFCAATGRKRLNDMGWGRDLHPAINVSWEDAQAYLEWLNGELGVSGSPSRYRLLSEAEWEYCCRAGTETPFSFGETISTNQANYNGNGTYGSGSTGEYRERTVPVGSLPANTWGLFEMHGNVWEWVEDRWHDSYAGAPADGSAWIAGEDERRVLRGGSWFDGPGVLRSAFRFRYTPGLRYGGDGFRVSRTLSR